MKIDWENVLNTGLKILDSVVTNIEENEEVTIVTRRVPSFNQGPSININIFENPLYKPIYKHRHTFLEFIPLAQAVNKHPNKFRTDEWSLEYSAIESCLRVKYGIMDMMTIRFCDKKGHAIFGIHSGVIFDAPYMVKIGGMNTFWDANHNNTVKIRIDSFTDEVDWRLFGTYGLPSYLFLMKMLQKVQN